MSETSGNTQKNVFCQAPTLAELHSLWEEASDMQVPPEELKGKELEIYFNGTVVNMLREIDELKKIAETQSDQQLAERFKVLRPRMMLQLRMFTEIGMALWPQPITRLGSQSHKSD